MGGLQSASDLERFWFSVPARLCFNFGFFWSDRDGSGLDGDYKSGCGAFALPHGGFEVVFFAVLEAQLFVHVQAVEHHPIFRFEGALSGGHIRPRIADAGNAEEFGVIDEYGWPTSSFLR